MAFRARNVLVRRPAWQRVLEGALTAGVAGAALLWSWDSDLVWGAFVVTVGALGMYLAHRRRPRRGEVVADRDGLSVDGALVIGREQLSTAEIRDRAVTLRRGDRRPGIELRALTSEDAEGLVAALELSVSQKSARFPLEGHALNMSTAALALVGMIIGGIGLGIRSVWLGLAGAFITMGVAALVFRERPALSVGADGILIERYGRRRFIAFGDIARVDLIRAVKNHVTGPGSWTYLEVELRAGDVVRVRLEKPNHRDTKQFAPFADRLLERIGQAVELSSAEPLDPLDERTVQRGAQTSSEWLAKLRALAADAGYRAQRTSEETLWHILGDHRAEPSARLGAAVALRSMGKAPRDERLRIAIDTVAEPNLQRALRIANDAQADDELVAALDQMQDEAHEVVAAKTQ